MAEDGKLKIDNIRRKTSREYTNYLLSAEDRYRVEGTTEGRKQNRNKLKLWIRRLTRQLEILMTHWHVALRIRLRIVLWILVHHSMLPIEKKNIKYIPSLKRRLISVGQLDEEGYHVGFKDQQWKVTKSSLVVACIWLRIGISMLASKGNVPDVQKVDIYFYKPGGLGKQNNLSFIISVKTRNYKAGVTNMIVMLKMVPKTPLRFGVAERLSRTFRVESTGLRAEAPKMLWANSVRSGSDEMRYSFQDTKSHQVIRSRDITFVDSIYGATSVTDSSSFTKPIQKRQMVLVDIPENLAEHDIIVAEHGLRLEITQSPGGSSDTSEGSENSGSFEDSRRSDKEDSEDGASSEEGGSKTL
ncbi:hypothetical protein Tco_0858702 [Tanacetum coccineum]|uniref:Uncharacterized protein n=1 Tax=Tanacetum coccineum TaxID=301880 RepID=A0ABQ5BA09_9ASTR